MIPIPDEEKSLYDPDHMLDRVSLYLIAMCVSVDFVYFLSSVLFVRMWYESQPSFLQICKAIAIHHILYWMILLDLYVYSRTVHYTNHTPTNLRNSDNDTISSAIVMVTVMCTSVSLVVFMTYRKLQHTRQWIIEGGPPPLPVVDQHPSPQEPMLIVITGANTGIGKETVRHLYHILSGSGETDERTTSATTTTTVPPTARIVLLCRSIEKGQEAIQDILSHYPSRCITTGSTVTTEPNGPSSSRIPPTTLPCQLLVIPCDLCSFQSIRNAVTQILSVANTPQPTSTDHPKKKVIHTLINNAGVMMSQLSYTPDDHHETCLQANFLGHFLLTGLLLPHISTSIINVTSSTYQLNVKPLLIPPPSTRDGLRHPDYDPSYSWNDNDIQCRSDRRKYTLFGQYAITKWCNILHTIYLSKHYSHLLHSSSVHPGLVRTDVTRNMPYYLRIPNEIFAILLQTLQKTPTQGAWNTIHVFTLAAKYYGTNKVTNGDNSDESTPLQQQPQPQRSTQFNHKSVQDSPNRPSGQYWVNRQPQSIPSRRHFATRIDEQAEALWDWAVTQVRFTKDEIQQLQQLKQSSISTVANDHDTNALTTSAVTTSQHSKVE